MTSDAALPGGLSARLHLELGSVLPEVQEAWAGYQHAPWLALRAGRVRVPFGLAQQIQLASLPLLEAPLVAGSPKDVYDVGLWVGGALPGGWASWAAALTAGTRVVTVDVNERPDAVAQLQLHPLVAAGPWLAGLTLAASAGYGQGPNRSGLRVETMAEHTVAAPPLVRGAQARWSTGLRWEAPGLRLCAEYQWQAQQRAGLTSSQRIGSEYVSIRELAPWVVFGAYGEVAWLVLGRPSTELPAQGLELAARFEGLQFGDGTDLRQTAAGTEDHAPLNDSWIEALTLAANIFPRSGLRLSLAWQLTRFGQRVLSPDREVLDISITPSAWAHSAFVRLQLALL